MYNGVGLPTPRGSGTSGHIQRNLGQLPVRRLDLSRQVKKPAKKLGDRKPDKAILEHMRKRKLELRIQEYMDELRDQGMPDDEIEELADKKRKDLYATLKDTELDTLDSKIDPAKADTHERVMKKREEDRRLREAFGIKD